MVSLPFLVGDRACYTTLARGVHDTVGGLHRAFLRVDVRLRRGNGPGALLALLDDALTVRDHAPVDPPAEPAEYRRVLSRLEELHAVGTSHGTLFQRRNGVGILQSVVQELAHVGAATTGATGADPLADLAAALVERLRPPTTEGTQPGSATDGSGVIPATHWSQGNSANPATPSPCRTAPTIRRRGRPTINKEQDARIWDAWHTKGHADLADLAHKLGMKKAEVQYAIDRERKRRKKSGG